MSNVDEGRFMVAMGAIIENELGQILLVKRSNDNDYKPEIWEYPMGRIKQFENPVEGLKREVREETRLEIEIIKPLKVFSFMRGEKDADNEVVGVVYWAKIEGSDDNVTLSDEHTEYKWVTPDAALDLIDHRGIREDLEYFIDEQVY
ncbi:NUDIX domain-containing protein [Candidatus Daviesbacteria bacterium]|nr:NUDIX domain-containing protein [Candidatus Daviesbacteria bacterium]